MIDSQTVNDLNNVANQIKQRIQAYADLHNISLEEAQKRASIIIENNMIGIKIESEDGEN